MTRGTKVICKQSLSKGTVLHHNDSNVAFVRWSDGSITGRHSDGLMSFPRQPWSEAVLIAYVVSMAALLGL